MTPELPTWVRKRDGRRELFDADKISQALYATTEEAGAANAFLARELTESVLHFLAQENTREPTTAEIADLVEKVVRELGQPELARRFGERHAGKRIRTETTAPRSPPRVAYTFARNESAHDVVKGCLRTYSLHSIFSRDLAAAHDEGWLVLSGLEQPDFLESLVVDPVPHNDGAAPWQQALVQLRQARLWAATLVFDSLEAHLAEHGPQWWQGIVAGLSDTNVAPHRCLFNIAAAAPPPWAVRDDIGPLFDDAKEHRGDGRGTVLELLLTTELPATAMIAWHVQNRDLVSPPRRAALLRALGRSDLIARIAFVFDRADQATCLNVGVDREHPATLMTVGLRLRRFAALPEVDGDLARLLAKLPSLVRMAVSAGSQKRAYLRRRRPELTRGFLLDRARLVVAIEDLTGVVHQLTGATPEQSRLALDAARHIVHTISGAAGAAARTTGLDLVVVQTAQVRHPGSGDSGEALFGQRQAAAKLLEGALDGTIQVVLPPGTVLGEDGLDHLEWALRNSNARRLRLVELAARSGD
ncbi:MAG: ATP cone domain-containing protein [Gemmataceae bacterium]|nr:ATP cone domain-containing protein [Gemmataceae bacterium]